MKGYPDWFSTVIIATVVFLFFTGCLLIPTMLDFRLEWDMPWKLSGKQRVTVAALHVILSYFILIIMGSLWRIHMRVGLRIKQNRYSGFIMVATLLGLTITGVGIFYLGDERLSITASVVHLLTGGLIPLLFFYHFIKGRALAKERMHRISQHS